MARYFFHVHDGSSIPDREGTELPSLRDAQVEAFRLIGALIDDHATMIELGEYWTMDVTDAADLLLFRIDFMVTPAAAIGPVCERAGAH